ncbi:MAG: V-type ATP synthase subunit D [Eubacterium sp.]|nr:V-type ATP synthase subunit D [Eubacterium sp.]
MVNPTRMELTKQKKKLVSASRGHKLLKDKRDELVRQFMELVVENMNLRKKVEQGLKAANMEFALARAGMSREVLNTAMMASNKSLDIQVSTKNVMSVEIPQFSTRAEVSGNDIYSYGYAFTTGDLDEAVYSLSTVFEDMLKLAEIEKSCQLMAAEIEKTRRRVNALEHVIIPEAQANIKYITMKLDENERSTQIRLMKVKNMVAEKAIQEKKKQEQ